MVLVVAAATAQADPDPWFGSDKAVHFAVSGVLAIGAYHAAMTFSDSAKARIAYGASVALIAGVGKELWDASGNGNASFKDLAWDVLGAAVGVAICWAIDTLIFGIPTRALPSTALGMNGVSF